MANKNKGKSSLPSLKKESAVADEKIEETQGDAAEEKVEETAQAGEPAEASAEGAAEEQVEEAGAAEGSAEEDGSEEAEEAAAAEAPQEEPAQAVEQAAAAEEVAAPAEESHEEHHEDAHAHAKHEVEVHDDVDGYLAYFDYPDDLMYAAEQAHKAGYKDFDAFSPFPIHGMDDAIGLGRSWLPWVTFGAGATGFTLANLMQFGMLTFDWPMIIGGKPYAPWPSFVPIMFELTVLIGGVTTALVMLIAAGCFRNRRILDPEFTNDRFALWISAKDAQFEAAGVVGFMESLHPVEIRPVHKETT